MKSRCGQTIGSCGLPNSIFNEKCSPACPYKNMKIISICIPSKGITDPAFAVALRLLQLPLEKEDRYEVLQVSGADVAVARNNLAGRAAGDYILFIDDDVLLPTDALVKLISHNKDIICGLYYSRQEPFFPQIYYKNKESKDRYDAVFEPEGLIEIDACGGGCLLIKKEVFDKLEKPYFHYIPRGEKTLRKGEDLYFCEKAKEAGFKIYCDTSVKCGHMGTKVITSDYWEISKQRLKDLEESLGKEKFEELKKQQWDN